MPVKVPQLFKWLYPSYVWDYFGHAKGKKVLYLTFDDGPIHRITPWILEQLRQYNAKATFFMIGDNVAKNPNEFKEVVQAGHRMGSHSHNHLNGWNTENDVYVENVLKGAKQLKTSLESSGFSTEDYLLDKKFFRPPYAKIKRKQAKALQALGFKIVMYDCVAYDWDEYMTGKKCAENIIKNAKSGSIVVFHDSLKAEKNLKVALPLVLEHFAKAGYTFEML